MKIHAVLVVAVSFAASCSRCSPSSSSSPAAVQPPAAAAAARPADPQDEPKVWVLAFGIDAYPGRSRLPNCVNDATDIVAWVHKNGVPREQLVLMTDAQCTRRGMLDALAALGKRAKAGDEVLVYYSGHGSQERDQNGDEADGADESWVSIDLDQLLDDELEAAIAKIPGTVYLLSDSCHSGTVSKDIELGDDEVVGKYITSTELAKARGNGEGFTPREVAVERRQQQEQQNSTGGSCTPAGGIGTPARLFSACSDDEVANASRRERNSAFTGQLLAVLAESRPGTSFGALHQQVTARLRNRAYRHPQNPALFQLAPTQALPGWLCGSTAATIELATATRAQVNAVVDGLQRREDAAANQRQDWIQGFRTASGRLEGRTGEEFGLQVEIAPTAPAQVWLCVFNVSPTGKLTLLYPNGYDGNRPLGPGRVLEIGCGASEAGLKLQGAPGTESMVAFALQWDPFAGIDFGAFAGTDHVFLATPPVAGRGEHRQQALMRAREVGVSRKRARPGEGWDRATLELKHRAP